MSIDVRRYLQDLVIFLRMHRAVDSGVSPRATLHFELLARYGRNPPAVATAHSSDRCVTSLHGQPYVTPALVALAAKKVYPHRIVITKPEDERSMQWGSKIDAVVAALRGVTPESVIDDVLDKVDVPL